VLAAVRVAGGGVAVTLLLAPLLDVDVAHAREATLEVTWQPSSEVCVCMRPRVTPLHLCSAFSIDVCTAERRTRYSGN
jgi:hypothetical protein